MFLAVAARARKSFWPARSSERRDALLLAAIPGEKSGSDTPGWNWMRFIGMVGPSVLTGASAGGAKLIA